MITHEQTRQLCLTPRMKRTLEYVLKRAQDEFEFPVTLEFIQSSKRTRIYTETRAWVAVALKITGGEEWAQNDIKRVLGQSCHKLTSASIHRGRQGWRRNYWHGFALRWKCDAVDLFQEA